METLSDILSPVARQQTNLVFFRRYLISLSSLAVAAATLLFISGSARGQSTATVTIQANQPGAVVSSNLFGIFFEEINYGGEGGIYGEMVSNRSFASSVNPDFWSLTNSGTAAGNISVDTSLPLNTNNLASLKLTMSSGTGSVGAVNAGFWGMSLLSGATYDLNLYARGVAGFSGPVQVRLQNSSGSTIYAQTSFSGLTANWQRFSAALVSSGTDTNAQLVVSISTSGTVGLDEVSLVPRATFNNRTNGLRLDLANLLADLKPSFLRYPGGNFIEANNLTNSVRWKNTIGDVAARPGHLNDAWGYWSTDGYGLDEAFRQCEDMGMGMLYGINAGLSLGYNGNTNNTVPLDQMGPWVQDALDLIQYANGDSNATTWGALRAANGHPQSYNLQYLEIGNENGGPYYNDRYALFYDAIKSNYPALHLIAPDWGGIPTSRPVEIQDEHYYSDPATFISYATKYDSYSRSGPKVFVGEYAVKSGYGTYGNLSAALGEASFMTGMERNSDIVLMASYAPLFANVNGTQWQPDLVYYNNAQAFGTPSYYVQQMFSRNRGDVVLPLTVVVPASVTNPPPRGAIGVGSWNTSVQYTNLVVTSNGVTLYQSDFVHQGTNGWRVFNGTWSPNSGVYQQTAQITDCYSTYINGGGTNWANYTLSLRVCKTGGAEGFLILFNYLDDNNFTWLNIGGWGNTLTGIEQTVNGTKTMLGTRVAASIQNNQWYNISIVLTGPRMQCYVDGTLVQDVTLPTTSPAGLHSSATYDQRDQQIIIKAVNPYGQPLATTFNLTGVASVSNNATMLQLTSGSPSDENSFSAPKYVFPVTNAINNAGTNFTVTLPANSLSILRLQLSGPLPPSGFRAAASGWQVALSWAAYNSATNYVLKRATAIGGPYTTVAVTNSTTYVDSNVAIGVTYYYMLSAQLPSGPTPDTTPVSAAVGVTLQASLPFDDGSGTLATDVTGNGWGGTLVNGSTWVSGYSNGAVNLSGSSQYVSLPNDVVSNLNNFAITAWVNVSRLTDWARIFDFGSGTSAYMFLAPQSGSGTLRFAITTSGNGAEQQINASAALPMGGWHHIGVTLNNGMGVLYLDGVAVGTNSAMTLSPSSLGATSQNWIGRSQFSADPYLTGVVDDFRIYSGALSPGEVATFLTPLMPPTGLSATPGDSQATLTWNASANADGYVIASSTNSGGPYVLKATNLVGLAFTDTKVQNGVTYYYVVSATNAVGGSANSPPASVRPVSMTPPSLALTFSGGQLQFTWPVTHTGWHLQVQTNSLGTNWFNLSGTQSTNLWFVLPDPADGSVFYRLIYP